MNSKFKSTEVEIDYYLKLLFPLCRSITGDGNRQTLEILQKIAPIKIKEYPSGSQVYDWTIPEEWNINNAYIKDDFGNTIIDFKHSNIHVMGYSIPVDKKISFNDLESHLYYMEDTPKAIPYRTSYYKKTWGFCVTKKQYKQLKKAKDLLHVFIDSSFNSNGGMTIGELVIPGISKQEILISTYFCHPSLANDNLSGVVMTAFLAKELIKRKSLNYSYRIIWVPETIGAISYCAMNEDLMKRISTGLVVTTVGGPGEFGYKQSFNPDSSINDIIEGVFENNNIKLVKYPFDIRGSDERQYSSQGFRMNIASIVKDKYYEYQYYHTSLDNLDFVKSKYIFNSLNMYLQVVDKIDKEVLYKSSNVNCEVMLSKYDLYPTVGGHQLPSTSNLNKLDIILWLLWICDGKTSMTQIKNKLDIDIDILLSISKELEDKSLLIRIA